MRLLADENCDFALVKALREAGHDVISISEISPRVDDETVIERCVKEQRVLLTEDKDFGQLVFASGLSATGVVLMRFPATKRLRMVEAVVDIVAERSDQLIGRFTVVGPGKIRISRIP